MKEHNYIAKLNKLIKEGAMPPGTTMGEVMILHDDGCGALKTNPKRCNCDPDIKIIAK